VALPEAPIAAAAAATAAAAAPAAATPIVGPARAHEQRLPHHRCRRGARCRRQPWYGRQLHTPIGLVLVVNYQKENIVPPVIRLHAVAAEAWV
jgi:hypothetical protein